MTGLAECPIHPDRQDDLVLDFVGGAFRPPVALWRRSRPGSAPGRRFRQGPYALDHRRHRRSRAAMRFCWPRWWQNYLDRAFAWVYPLLRDAVARAAVGGAGLRPDHRSHDAAVRRRRAAVAWAHGRSGDGRPHASTAEKQALVKKEMRLLRQLVGPDADAFDLMQVALACAQKRVVLNGRCAPIRCRDCASRRIGDRRQDDPLRRLHDRIGRRSPWQRSRRWQA